jgi:hypothetical protein
MRARVVAVAHSRFWHEGYLPAHPGYVRCQMNYGRDVLAVRLSHFDPNRSYAAQNSALRSRPPTPVQSPLNLGMEVI